MTATAPTVSSRTVVVLFGRKTWRPNGNVSARPSSRIVNRHGMKWPWAQAANTKKVAHWIADIQPS